MFNFFKPKSEDLETLHTRVLDLQKRILSLEVNEEVFRNKVLRKVQQVRVRDPEEDLEEEEEEEEEVQINYNKGGLYRGNNTQRVR